MAATKARREVADATPANEAKGSASAVEDREKNGDTRGAEGKKIKQLTLRLPEEYHRKLKILAACSGKSMTEILVHCIDERLEHCLESELQKVK